MIRKVLIANRGEIAVRIIRACREMGILTVAVYSEADREALHAQLADEAVCIGPAPSKDSYLNMERILSAALVTGADAVHPGFGFLSENSTFARRCQECHITWIGPSPEVMDRLGNKSEATRGEFQNAFQTAQKEAKSSFADGTMYVERLIRHPRHVEFQIMADSFGNVIHLGERDCSIQRNHQKMIEESPCVAIDDPMRERMGSAAVRAAKAAHYVNAGTIEFLLEPDGNFYFMEMNTRIQVEHPVTEWVTGVDLIQEQLRVASGMPLSVTQGEVRLSGHAIECRINAENPAKNFRPCPGKITEMHLPGGFGVRVDTAAYDGYVIPAFYDSMLAKLIVHGRTREEAIARMRSALGEVVIEGVDTNVDYLYSILNEEEYLAGRADIEFVERLTERL